MKKIVVFIMSIILMFAAIPQVPVYANAPNGIYGNGLNGIYIDINSAPYTTYANKSYGQYAYGPKGCAWFASARANQLTGIDTPIYSGSSWYNSAYTRYGYSRGTVVREKALACYSDHVAVVEKVNGDTITVSEGGWTSVSASNGYSIVHTMSKAKLESARAGAFLGYVYLKNEPLQKPTNPQISKSQIWYDLGDTIEISAHADGATSYYMSMFKDNEKIIETGVVEGKFSMPARQYGEGKYSAYFSCSNEMGTVDTEWIDFSVVGPANYTDIYTDREWYDETDEIQITVDTVCAKGQVIGIDKEGVGRVYTEEVSNPFVISASTLGKGEYSVYYSVYNGSGGIDTKRIHFSIYGSPEEGAIPKIEKSRYGLEENITIKIEEDGKGIKSRYIGIDKKGVGRVYENNVSNPFTIAAKDLGVGEYSAYYSVYNGCGGYDTEKVYFTIYDEDEDSFFIDVARGDWYYDVAIYVSSNGIMTGLTKDTFGPDVTLTRAQFATILYRMNGEPAIDYNTKFSDVAKGQWYTNGVLWANSIGVVGGYGNGMFGPDDHITREQMAVMMYRYAKYKEYDISKTADISSFKDAPKVSGYAEDAFKWAVGSEIIGGKAGNMLEPQGQATRAECAAIIMRFMKQYEK